MFLLLVGIEFTAAIYVFAFEHLSLWQLSVREPWVWVAGLVLYDFCYYWVHRFGHTVALMWAAHVVHHQSVWFKHPGWRPADVAQRWPKPAFDIAGIERFDPPMSRGAQCSRSPCVSPCSARRRCSRGSRTA